MSREPDSYNFPLIRFDFEIFSSFPICSFPGQSQLFLYHCFII